MKDIKGQDLITIPFEKLYCIARLLQSCLHGYNQFTGCKNCKFNCSIKEDFAPNFEKNIIRLQEITGVDFNFAMNETPARFKKDKKVCGDKNF